MFRSLTGGSSGASPSCLPPFQGSCLWRFISQTNGICERFHKTIQDEFYAVAFRKKVYTSLEEFQEDVDAWIENNEERTHTGKYCYGKTPRETWRDSLHSAKAKDLSFRTSSPISL